MREKHKGNAGT